MLHSVKSVAVGLFVCAFAMWSTVAGQSRHVLGAAQDKDAEVHAGKASTGQERPPAAIADIDGERERVGFPDAAPVLAKKLVVEPPKRPSMRSLETADVRFLEADSLEELRRIRNADLRFPKRLDNSAKPDEPDDDPASPPLEKFHWKSAIYQSLIAQGFQHGYALVIQDKTRRALKGPFFREYWASIKGIRGWDDGNRFFTNYIAHPMQGGMTGFIYLQNHERLKKQTFNESAQYWKDRARAMLWSAAWSTNWEIGPISQASIGNVGYYGKGSYVDFVITPTVGTAWMIAEEALDRYLIRHAEKNLAARIVIRTALNPMRSVANLLRFKKPWYRDRAN